MTCQLHIDCFDEILEFSDGDNATLYSCLLVNRSLCKISVKILWRDIWRFQYSKKRSRKKLNSILSTLISCLSKESKEFLHKNGVSIISTLDILKPPLFNYATFCKVISIDEIVEIIDNPNQVIISPNTKKTKCLVTKEMIKMFMNQISSLKKLSCYSDIYKKYNPIIIGARDCLTNLSELSCPSNIKPEFFYQLSQICHNIKTLNITYLLYISDGLRELISSQHSLKILSLIQFNYYYCYDCYDDDSFDEEDDSFDEEDNSSDEEDGSS